jgi:hypothetical protein
MGPVRRDDDRTTGGGEWDLDGEQPERRLAESGGQAR